MSDQNEWSLMEQQFRWSSVFHHGPRTPSKVFFRHIPNILGNWGDQSKKMWGIKGQLISKYPFGVFKSPEKPTKFFPGFLPSPLKRGQTKKKGQFIPLIEGFYFDSLTLLFWFDLFSEARAEILEKNLLVFWKTWRHQKDILKLTDL